MSEEITPIRALPSELYHYEFVKREQAQIKIRLERRRHKEVTIIEGLEEPISNLKKLAKKLKTKLACGGTVKNGRIELQGDHRFRVKQLLVELGYNENQIFIVE